MAGAARDERRDYRLNFEETELRLGLPGGNGGSEAEAVKSGGGKRGFSETVDLKLNLSMKDDEREKMKAKMKGFPGSSDSAKPPSKAQVVGWPPVKSFRKNTMSVQKNSSDEDKQASSSSNATFVKVSMDGAPYLRKVDLRMYKSYQELSGAIGKMFSSFTVGNCGSNSKATKEDLTNESRLIDLLNGSEYVSTYEDKDGDWMLVGDLPWKMFVDSCKCIRIMKGSEAIGLAPRAIENCKNRS